VTASLCAQSNSPAPWWNERFPGGRFSSSVDKELPLIRVLKNHFVDPDGKTVVFRGVSVADPDKLERQGHWDTNLFTQVKSFGANLVRLPVHPAALRGRGAAEYFKLLDQAVDWCAEREMYVIIDWHSIGNLKTELFQSPMYDTTQKETFEFWRSTARHYRGNHTVAFYELFNEPTLFRNQLGPMSWSEWKKLNEDMILLIRAFDTEKIPLVAGLDWAYDLTALNTDPIQAEGIGYVTHPYANKRSKPWEGKWEEDYGFAADKYPMIATEIGFGQRSPAPLKPDDYGNAIVNYLEKKGISWTAWCFDPEWGPTLLKNWNYELTGSGAFFKEAIQSHTATTNAAAPPSAP